MALFKISKGVAANLPTTYVEGYCYLTTDDGKFYIDTTNTAAGRICLNAAYADYAAEAESATTLTNVPSITWTAASTVGPSIAIKAGEKTSNSAAIPVATAAQSGVITTTTQSLAGNKTLTGNFFTTQSSGESDLGVEFINGGKLYLWGNTTSGTRGLYDSEKGYVIQVTDTTATFTGSLLGNASSATTATSAGTLNTATNTLSTGIESSAITTASMDNNVLGNTLEVNPQGAIRSAIDFAWYESHWRIGNIRGGSTNSDGFGFAYQANGSSTFTLKTRISPDGYIYANRVYNAVWNDYAEYRTADTQEPGRVVAENGDDTLSIIQTRLAPFAGVVSDTFGFAEGRTDTAKTPLAVAGRVLVYTFKDRNEYKPGDCVCAAPNGTVDIMTREEIMMYPDRIVGTVSCVPDYTIWGSGNIKVNGRIWIKVR